MCREYVHLADELGYETAVRILVDLPRRPDLEHPAAVDNGDAVGDGFGLGQVEFIVEEGTLAEFTWPGQAAPQLQAALQQHRDDLVQVFEQMEDTYLRTNFSKSDNRGYRDGDPGSSRFFDRFADEQEEGSAMYNSPRHRVERDEEGNLIREYDKSNYRTTLINDEVRVYKGGSWRDRAYWLDPAQRRYLPQYMATDYLGFRCAMSRVGSKSKGKNKTVRGKKVKK